MFQFKNLDTYREQRLISRAEMARKTGLSPLTITKLEGGRSCRPDTAKKILESLEIYLNGSNFSYDEKKNDSTVYISPALRPNSVQLILKRVIEDEIPPKAKPSAKPAAEKPKAKAPAEAAKKTPVKAEGKPKPKPKR
jgi:transcriptional regulator with XRE-family HTH domain